MGDILEDTVNKDDEDDDDDRGLIGAPAPFRIASRGALEGARLVGPVDAAIEEVLELMAALAIADVAVAVASAIVSLLFDSIDSPMLAILSRAVRSASASLEIANSTRSSTSLSFSLTLSSSFLLSNSLFTLR